MPYFATLTSQFPPFSSPKTSAPQRKSLWTLKDLSHLVPLNMLSFLPFLPPRPPTEHSIHASNWVHPKLFFKDVIMVLLLCFKSLSLRNIYWNPYEWNGMWNLLQTTGGRKKWIGGEMKQIHLCLQPRFHGTLVYNTFIAFSSLKCTKNFPPFPPWVLPKHFVYPVIDLFTLNCNYLFLFVFSPRLWTL